MLKKVLTILGIIAAGVALGSVVAFTIPHTNLLNQRNDWIKNIAKDKDLSEQIGYASDTKYNYNRITIAYADDLYSQDPNNYMRGLQHEYDQYDSAVTVQFKNETDFDCDLVIIDKDKLYSNTGLEILKTSQVNNSGIIVKDNLVYLFLSLEPNFPEATLTSDDYVFEDKLAFPDAFMKKSFKDRVSLVDSCIQCYNLALDSDLRKASDGTKEVYAHSFTTLDYKKSSEVIINKSTVESTQSTSEESTSSN